MAQRKPYSRKPQLKPLSRRTVLKGACATLALPFLSAMRPAGPLIASTTSSCLTTGPKRVAFMYIPNGVIGRHWFPSAEDQSEETDWLAPKSLQPLKSVRDDIVVINGLNRTHVSGEPHSQAASCWMTSSNPFDRPDGTTSINTTLDQLIARQVGKATAFPSLELSCNSFTDNMEPKLFDAISWYGPNHDARSQNDPIQVFQRLFGDSATVNRSILDTVMEDAKSLKGRLGADDNRKLNEYLESIRAIERRMDHQKASRGNVGKVDFKMPEQAPENRGDYMRLMGDMMVLALQTDQTRVASFMVGPERWETPQLYDGVFDRPVQHHQMTHDNAYDEQVALIDQFHVEQYRYLIERMKNIEDGEGSLLDNCLFVLGSGIGDGNSHSYKELPTIVAGGKNFGVETGRQVACASDTPLANLWLTIANQMGAKLNSFADSTGPLKDFV